PPSLPTAHPATAARSLPNARPSSAARAVLSELSLVIPGPSPAPSGARKEASMLERIAFRMNLNPGRAAEYRRRHDEIWPELVALLREAGVSDYSIWLDPETHHLFATLVRTDDHTMDRLPENEIMARWWA